MSPARILLIIFAAACLIGGGGVLYLDIGNKPMVYYSITDGFNYEYAITFALMGAAYFGPILFFIGLMLYGIGALLVAGIQLLLQRK
jgi:hypothetical protein